MVARERLRLLSIALPARMGRIFSAVGLHTVMYGLFRYTFFGEFFGRLFRDSTGFEPIESFREHQTNSANSPQSQPIVEIGTSGE